MPPKLVLIFPQATVAQRAQLRRVVPQTRPRPPHGRQVQRLTPRFNALDQQFGTIQPTTLGVDPEQVIVLETVGPIEDFQNAVRRLRGLEWLGDFDVDVAAPDPGFLQDGTAPTELSGRLFVIVGNRTAYRQLLQLWNQWSAATDERLPRNFGRLAEVFKYLQDVREWNVEDRVRSTGVVEYWEKELAANVPLIHFDVELWCRAEEVERIAAFERLRRVVDDAGGRVLSVYAFTGRTTARRSETVACDRVARHEWRS